MTSLTDAWDMLTTPDVHTARSLGEDAAESAEPFVIEEVMYRGENPYSTRDPRHFAWKDGFLEVVAKTYFRGTDSDIERNDAARRAEIQLATNYTAVLKAQEEASRAAEDMQHVKLISDTPTAEEVAKEIDVPLSMWPDNCYGIACRLIDTDWAKRNGLRPLYGFWNGYDSRKSTESRIIARHGWCVTSDGLVVDPTRWVFECSTPKIYVGTPDFYDAGMQKFKLYSFSDKTENFRNSEPMGRVIDLRSALTEDEREFVQIFIPKNLGDMSNVHVSDLSFLANYPIGIIGPQNIPVLESIFNKLDMNAMFSMDFCQISDTLKAISTKVPEFYLTNKSEESFSKRRI